MKLRLHVYVSSRERLVPDSRGDPRNETLVKVLARQIIYKPQTIKTNFTDLFARSAGIG